MPKAKTATLNLRIDPCIKEAIRTAAEREHRSVANMVEMLIRRHSATAGIRIPEQAELPRRNTTMGIRNPDNADLPRRNTTMGSRNPDKADLPPEQHDE